MREKPIPRWFAWEYARGRWHVCDRANGDLPIYDDNREGKDKPLIWKDGDEVMECVQRLNQAEDEKGNDEQRD